MFRVAASTIKYVSSDTRFTNYENRYTNMLHLGTSFCLNVDDRSKSSFFKGQPFITISQINPFQGYGEKFRDLSRSNSKKKRRPVLSQNYWYIMTATQIMFQRMTVKMQDMKQSSRTPINIGSEMVDVNEETTDAKITPEVLK